MSAGVDVDIDVGNGTCVDLYVVSAGVDVCIGICVAFVCAGVSVDVCRFVCCKRRRKRRSVCCKHKRKRRRKYRIYRSPHMRGRVRT